MSKGVPVASIRTKLAAFSAHQGIINNEVLIVIIEIKIDDLSAAIKNSIHTAMCCHGPMCDTDCAH
jgi:hypothetical protein